MHLSCPALILLEVQMEEQMERQKISARATSLLD